MTKGVWEEPASDDASEEERIGRLERVTQGYHDVIGEGGRLLGAVGNLDSSAAAIRSVLTRVESNQQALIAVRSEGEKTRGMVHTIRDDQSREKRRMRLAAFTIAATLFFITLASCVGAITYARAVQEADARSHAVSVDICNRRNSQSSIMQSYFDHQVQQIQTMGGITPAQRAEYLKEAKQLRSAFPVIDCSKLAR